MDYQSIRRGASYKSVHTPYSNTGGAACPKSVRTAENSSGNMHCGCTAGYCITDTPSLAMVYAPCQEFKDIFDLETGFCRGTIFCQLYKPWMPDAGREVGYR